MPDDLYALQAARLFVCGQYSELWLAARLASKSKVSSSSSNISVT